MVQNFVEEAITRVPVLIQACSVLSNRTMFIHARRIRPSQV